MCVDPDYRGCRLGQRLYDERRKLCETLGLKGIVFVGRLPSRSRQLRRFGTVENDVGQVKQKKQRDPVLTFQLRNRFEIIGVIEQYLPVDRDSLGYGVHMVWRNPRVSPSLSAEDS